MYTNVSCNCLQRPAALSVQPRARTSCSTTTAYSHARFCVLSAQRPLRSRSTAALTFPPVAVSARRLASASRKPMSCSCEFCEANLTAGLTGAAGAARLPSMPVAPGVPSMPASRLLTIAGSKAAGAPPTAPGGDAPGAAAVAPGAAGGGGGSARGPPMRACRTAGFMPPMPPPMPPPPAAPIAAICRCIIIWRKFGSAIIAPMACCIAGLRMIVCIEFMSACGSAPPVWCIAIIACCMEAIA